MLCSESGHASPSLLKVQCNLIFSLQGAKAPKNRVNPRPLAYDELGMRKKLKKKKQQNYEAVDLRDGRQAGRHAGRAMHCG